MAEQIRLHYAITRAVESVDDETGVESLFLEGLLLDEQLDKYQKIIDYAESRPFVEAWSAEINELSGGKSDGNVRLMHGLALAGKVEPGGLRYDDDAKQIWARVKVVTDDAKKLVHEGCVTSFSVGASIKRTWRDSKNPKIERLAIAPYEMSLVDNPGQFRTGTGFEIVRASGAVERIPFKESPVKIDPALVTRAAAAMEKGQKLMTALRAAGAADDMPLVAIAGAAPDTVRGLWDVCRLSELLQGLSYLAESTKVEAEYEGDNSPIPAELAALVVKLGDALIALTVEEVGELTERFLPEATEGDAAALAAGATERVVRALTAGTVQRGSGVLHARHMRRLQRMHDWVCELGAACTEEDDEPGDETTTRAAVPSGTAAQQEDPMDKEVLLAAMPELARALGPQLKETVELAIAPVKAAADENRAAVDALRTENADLKRVLGEMGDRLKTLEDKPAPPKGVTRAVTKDGDNGAGAPTAIDPATAQPLDIMRAVVSGQPIVGVAQ